MSRPSALTISVLVGCAAAATVCMASGGVVGVGVLVGFLSGAALGLACLDALKRTSRQRPELAFHAYLGTIAAKALVMVGVTLALRYVESLGAHADWRAFLVAYVGASLIVLLAGTPAAVRACEREVAHS